MRRYGLVFRDAEDLEIASAAPNGKNSKTDPPRSSVTKRGLTRPGSKNSPLHLSNTPVEKPDIRGFRHCLSLPSLQR
jgi:hypothetical protein